MIPVLVKLRTCARWGSGRRIYHNIRPKSPYVSRFLAAREILVSVSRCVHSPETINVISTKLGIRRSTGAHTEVTSLYLDLPRVTSSSPPCELLTWETHYPESMQNPQISGIMNTLKRRVNYSGSVQLSVHGSQAKRAYFSMSLWCTVIIWHMEFIQWQFLIILPDILMYKVKVQSSIKHQPWRPIGGVEL
jgi:hypothetical protein